MAYLRLVHRRPYSGSFGRSARASLTLACLGRRPVDSLLAVLPVALSALMAVGLAWTSAPTPILAVTAQPAAVANVAIVDGDTVRVDGHSIRLVGFNAPEIFSPHCPRERTLGNRAKDRLAELVAAGNVQMTRVACACRPGTEGTQRCNYGRGCGSLTIDGVDVGDVLMSEGLAVPYLCGTTSCPRKPEPWCD